MTVMRLSSRSGLRAEINANGSLRRLDCESICLPLFVGNELDGGPTNLYLRKLGGAPEWVALRWALARGVEVRFADLPATHTLAEEPDSTAERIDVISTLANAAGYDDAERWWEDAVEHRRSSSLAGFAALREAVAEIDGGQP